MKVNMIGNGKVESLSLASATVPVENGDASILTDATLSMIAHALDPIVDLLVAFSLPVASVIVVGNCFWFMLGKNDRGWDGIQKAGLGYILVQLSPFLLKVLHQVGTAL
jgi:hypothetical protein